MNQLSSNSVKQPDLRPVKQALFPTLESLQSVIDLAQSQLPITNTNSIYGLIMTYHNTMLKVMEEETNYVPKK